MERGTIVAEGDFVIVHGRSSGVGAPVNWIAADIVRIQNGILVEHWNVIQDEATEEQSKSKAPWSEPVPGRVYPRCGPVPSRRTRVARHSGGTATDVQDNARGRRPSGLKQSGFRLSHGYGFLSWPANRFHTQPLHTYGHRKGGVVASYGACKGR